ncbi:FAD-binding oxidoreductase [Streptomyces litchfieldiae]|uniref:FAD-binding oxidoreductase n=1 Tax=Streptomyces litchfieldiae TaxID=3075543 RepID=A0ABU2MSI9_9ACTN|nr:FAD-binding oxidoreductase [Streptomyces sp. DSM 44938]MDT0344054.1 FAD-binding oxidoreductase [Streptomyces sp. DSM 44938]
MTRRSLLAGTAAAGGTLMAGGPAAAAPADLAIDDADLTVSAGDHRYPGLVRGENHRFVGAPEYVRLCTTPAQVTEAVQTAVREGRRVQVRSGGHCYEDFVANAQVEVVIDLSEMKTVTYDPAHRAFAVEAGAKLGEVYETLFKGWGVTLPGGSCPTVGVGGHVAGGGYGQLNRSLGLIVDYLYAVEVVVVDAGGTARRVVATSDPADPNRDLWWAHTGGGGNFGVVTRYWFRTPGATGTDPAHLLPRPPAEMWISRAVWPWAALTEADFTRLVRNYGVWCERNSAASSPYVALFSRLTLTHRTNGLITLASQIDATVPGAEDLLGRFLTAIGDGVGVRPDVWDRRRLPWLHTTTWRGMFDGDATYRADFKSSYLRTRFPDEHIAAFHRNLTRADYANPAALVQISSYGGRTNTVSPSATAVAQRDSVMKLHYLVSWGDERDDASHIAWIREFYRDVHSATGGVPVPDAVTDGCFVNYADIDLSDPQWNTSGVPWHRLYYKDNYAKLQQMKARWDPRDTFRHAQSVRLPGAAGSARGEG